MRTDSIVGLVFFFEAILFVVSQSSVVLTCLETCRPLNKKHTVGTLCQKSFSMSKHEMLWMSK